MVALRYQARGRLDPQVTANARYSRGGPSAVGSSSGS